MLLGSHSQTVGKPVYFSFKWCHFWKEHLCWWAAKYMWVCSTNENSFSAKQLILLLTLDWSCLVDWMIEVWRNKTYWQFKDFVVSQRGCVGHSGPSWSHKCSMVSRSGLPAGHSILFTLSSVPDWSYGVATCCRISSRYLSALRLPSMMTSLVFQWGRCHLTPSHCLHQEMLLYWCSIAVSASPPHFDPMIQLQ